MLTIKYLEIEQKIRTLNGVLQNGLLTKFARIEIETEITALKCMQQHLVDQTKGESNMNLSQAEIKEKLNRYKERMDAGDTSDFMKWKYEAFSDMLKHMTEHDIKTTEDFGK